MVDRQQKEDFYQQQLAQAAWANLRAGGAPGYGAPHTGFAAPATGHPPGGGAPSTNPYQNYMMQLQQFAAGGQGANFSGGGGAGAG